MGKFVGFVGTIRGKVGNVVFSKGEKGITYGRAYQPQVMNPKSAAQLEQRARMNLVGRMSQVTPKELLVGLGLSTNRQRRSAFTSHLLSVATVDVSSTAVVAKVAPEDVVFSRGAVTPSASVTTPVVITATSVTMGLTPSSEAVGHYGERVIVAVIDPSSKGGYSYLASDVVFFNVNEPVQVSIPVREIVDESLVSVYRLPFRLSDSAAIARTETLYNDGTDIIAQLLSGQGMREVSWGQSLLEVSQVFTRA